MNHIQDLINLSHEPPVQDFISAIHRNSAASGLFIQAIQSRCENLSTVSLPGAGRWQVSLPEERSIGIFNTFSTCHLTVFGCAGCWLLCGLFWSCGVWGGPWLWRVDALPWLLVLWEAGPGARGLQ